MTFGEALRAELIQIGKLNNKVFPVVAPQSTAAPFLVYQRESADFTKTLQYSAENVSAIYILTLLTNSYAEKEELEELIKDKILTFLLRKIGQDGPYIQGLGVTLLNENYEYEPDMLSSRVRVEVDY